MFPSALRVGSLLAGLAGCAGGPAGTAAAAGPEVDVIPGEQPATAVTEAALAVDAASESPAEQPFAFWKDADFKRRFAESYLYETDVEPRMTSSERDFMQEVLELIVSEQVEKAIARLQGRQGSAASAVIDYTLGNLYLQRDRLPEAAREYQTAVAKFPKFRRAWKNLGLIHTRRGEHRDAARAFVRVIELGGGDALTYGLLGFAHSAADDQIAAESAYRMAALMDPVTLDWRMGLARTFFRQRRFAEAASLCGALIEQYPERTDLWLLQANAFVGCNETGRAAENLELIDRLGQSTFDSLALLADLYVNDGLHDLAAQAYLRAMAKDDKARPDRPMRAAAALSARGAYPECQMLVDGIERHCGARLDDRAKKELLKLRARLAVAAGASSTEAKVLEQIVALDPLDGEALILLGQFHARQGDRDRAIFRFEQAASIEAFEADAKYQQARMLAGEGSFAAALPLLRRAQQLKPRDAVQKLLDQVERVAQGK